MEEIKKLRDSEMILIEEGMILARDVSDVNGRLLYRKNTLLDKNKISILKSHGVPKIPIAYIEPKNKNKEKQVLDNDRIFGDFKEKYEESVENVKNSLINIGNGGIINIDDLFNLTSDMMKNLDIKEGVFGYLGSIKQSDEVTYGHCTNVALLCNLFGHWLNMNENEIIILTISGLLHDIGKIKIPDHILNKKGKLTKEEFEIIKTHTSIGFDLLKGLDIPEGIKLAALMHHEKIDGSGYPSGIVGSNINKYASIVSICDIYDAMTSNRSYRNKLSPFYVINTFEVKSYGEL